jgi:tol-pal system protein YbgF
MRRLFMLPIVLGSAVTLSACASSGRVSELDSRLEQLTTDIKALQRQNEITGRENAGLTVEIRTLTSRLRDTEVRLRDTTDRVASLGNRVAAAETSLREMIAAVEALPRLATPGPASIEPPRPATEESSAGAERVFANALKTFRSGEHGQAVLELMDFVGKYPTHPLVPRAQLWIGEAYFKQRDYRQALLEYRKAVDAAAPDSPAAADAWLRIGQTYAALRERPAAAEAWQRVMRDYPDTEAAGQAKTLLRR